MDETNSDEVTAKETTAITDGDRTREDTVEYLNRIFYAPPSDLGANTKPNIKKIEDVGAPVSPPKESEFKMTDTMTREESVAMLNRIFNAGNEDNASE